MSSRLFALVRSAFFATLFVSLWVWFIPRWIASSKGVRLAPDWNAVALTLMTAGGLIMVKCVWEFAWNGRGTPAPFDPPRRLVIHGLYRFVRNPMYVGMVMALIGLAFALPMIRSEMYVVAAAAWVFFSALAVLYEEPALRGKFGEDYLEYCRNVGRWIPRLTPFDKPGTLT